jgi:hypothetical protein
VKPIEQIGDPKFQNMFSFEKEENFEEIRLKRFEINLKLMAHLRLWRKDVFFGKGTT